MLKINSLLSVSQHNSPNQSPQMSQLAQLAQKAEVFKLLQKYWATGVEQLIAKNSFVTDIKNEQLTVFASNAIVASKIKLLWPQILIKLQYLQQSQPIFKDCKVSAIIVKVQVISSQKRVSKAPRKLSNIAANSLKSFAETLGETPLSTRLKSLADKNNA